MESLRKPFLIAALVLAVLIVLIELGKAGADALGGPPNVSGICSKVTDPETIVECLKIPSSNFNALADQQPPGRGIPYLAFVDGSVLFTLALMGVALVLPQRVVGRTQGCATAIYSLVIIIFGIIMIFTALFLLILMISLFLAVPFGTLAYLAIYGFFNRGGASAVLSLLMVLKIALGVCLVLAHQRMLQNKGLVLLIITSLVANVIVSFLHGLVPIILVSITDTIGAICGGILGVLWAIFLLIGAIISIIKVIRPD